MNLLAKYNTSNLKNYVTIKNLQKELTNVINEKEELNISNKELIKKNTILRKQVKQLKEKLKEKGGKK
jgi:hypothetical protein